MWDLPRERKRDELKKKEVEKLSQAYDKLLMQEGQMETTEPSIEVDLKESLSSSKPSIESQSKD